MENGSSPRANRRAIEKGAATARVAANVKALRQAQGLTLEELAGRTDKLGRPILRAALSKVETGDRRVDVDDLIVLAFALEVTPNRLLLTASGRDDEAVALYPHGASVSTRSAWTWACGEGFLGMEFAENAHPFTIEGRRRWIEDFTRVNRPHDPADLMPLEEMAPHLDQLQELARLIESLEEEGVSRKAAMNFVRWKHLLNDDREDA